MLKIGYRYEKHALRSRKLQYRARKEQEDTIASKIARRANMESRTEQARVLLEADRQKMITHIKVRAAQKETVVQH